MKKKNKSISKLAALTAMVISAFAPVYAQTNLGADCGCPAVASRTSVLVSTLVTNGGAADGELIATNTIFDCSKNWILDKKIYVPSGKTLTILPGTVIKGNTGTAANATALIVEVGGKIFADGSASCPIVFTAAADNLDGTFPISSNGQWGGICIAGKASNNLTLAANGPFQAGVGDGKICVADGIGTFEGFASSNSKDQFGATPAQFDDNDNSGILRYVSIRYAGAILQVGGELNALSLGSVGRGTIIEHIDVISCADDNIEVWGGTVNLKYLSFMFGNDDLLDYDDGWRGKAQFIFGIKSDVTANVDSDNGIEMDGDDQKSNLTPRSHPVIYNATFIGNSKTTLTSDNSGLAGLEAKELTEGEIYNSIFANYRYGFNVIKALGTRTGTSEAYHNWAAVGGNGSTSLIVKNNTFVGCTNDISVNKNGGAAAVLPSDSVQFFTTDGNVHATSIPGFTYLWAMNPSTNVVSAPYDAVPSPALASSITAPADGFFTPVNYRGAFAPGVKSWMSDYSYAALLGTTAGLVPCPTDINGDGITNNVDFLQLVGQFNQSCH